MSENEEIMNETENETMAAEVEAVETVETEAAEVEAADEVSDEEEAEVVEAAVDYDDEELMDKMQKAARLLRSRRFAISKEEEAKAERMANIERAIKLLDLKPRMEQKEMSDLLGMRLRELDGLMAEAEAADLVGRIDDAEGDMRKIVVFAAEDAAEGLVELANKKEKLLPELSYEEATELMAALDKVIAPLVAMGLDEDRGPRGGRDDRGGRGGDRGGRGGFGDRGGRGGDRGGRGGDRGGRGGFGDHGGDLFVAEVAVDDEDCIGALFAHQVDDRLHILFVIQNFNLVDALEIDERDVFAGEMLLNIRYGFSCAIFRVFPVENTGARGAVSADRHQTDLDMIIQHNGFLPVFLFVKRSEVHIYNAGHARPARFRQFRPWRGIFPESAASECRSVRRGGCI